MKVFPKVKTIQVNRVLSEDKNLRVLKLEETFEEDINGSTDEKVKYELKAIVNHHGKDITMGHYTCFAKRGADWVFFNDEQVSVLREDK